MGVLYFMRRTVELRGLNAVDLLLVPMGRSCFSSSLYSEESTLSYSRVLLQIGDHANGQHNAAPQPPSEITSSVLIQCAAANP